MTAGVKGFVSRYLVTIVYFAVLIFVFAFFYHRIESSKESQLAACQRGNFLRTVLSGNESVQYDFLNSAMKGREDAAKAFRDAGNVEQAIINENLARDYKGYLGRLRIVRQTDCLKVIK